MLLMAMGVDPRFVSIAVRVWQMVRVQLKDMAFGTSVTAVPTPLRVTVWGLPGALSVIESVPVSFPPSMGTKVTLMVQLAPAGRLEPQLSVSLKLALAAMLVMLSVAVPLLLSMTDCEALAVPTSWVAYVSIMGDKVAFGPVNPGCNRTETAVPAT